MSQLYQKIANKPSRKIAAAAPNTTSNQTQDPKLQPNLHTHHHHHPHLQASISAMPFSQTNSPNSWVVNGKRVSLLHAKIRFSKTYIGTEMGEKFIINRHKKRC